MQFHLSLHSPSLRKPPLPAVCKPMRRYRCPAVSAAAVRPQHQRPAEAATMYDLLSVAETAGPEEIKAAYRRQARRWHPDACPSSGDKRLFAQQFMRAREAYEVLSDPAIREDYDLTLSAGALSGSWAGALGGAVLFRKGAGRVTARDRGGFGDWESQLEGLKRRRSSSSAAADTWGNRMRSGDQSGPSDR